ncbi:MAG: malonic semialdehyde reductase [Candidatus Pacebacteria bacterium]|nr:malonic semialdehyde reductase [Candidatus Paceibacterota bacterium]
MTILDKTGADLLFREAYTSHAWTDKPISEELLKQVYDLTKYPPTSFNSQPGRYVFVKSPDAKKKLAACLMEGNVEQTLAAPVTVIVAHDMKFYNELPRTYPAFDAKGFFESMPAAIEPTAVRNGTLGGGYLMMAARAMGLDVGPMSGFDNAAVDAAFFAGTEWRSNFLINLGYGDVSKKYPRGLRLDFAEACKIV